MRPVPNGMPNVLADDDLTSIAGARSTTFLDAQRSLAEPARTLALPESFSRWLGTARTPARSSADDSDIVSRLYLFLVAFSILEVIEAIRPSIQVFDRHVGPPIEWLATRAIREETKRLRDALEPWVRRRRPNADGSASGETSGHAALDDPLGELHRELISRKHRQRHGEHFTPFWLAREIVDQLWAPGLRWIDPSAGAGAFVLSIARRQILEQSTGTASKEATAAASRSPRNSRQPRTSKTIDVSTEAWGIEANPWTVFPLAANLALFALGRPDHSRSLTLRALWRDPLWEEASAQADERRFDRVVGNPPWVLWDRLTPEDRRRLAPLMRRHGMFAEQGMNAILGGSKKDLAGLVIQVALERFAAVGGRLGMAVPLSLFKSTGGGRGFRRFALPNNQPFRIDEVHDLTLIKPFPDASVHAAVMYATKNEANVYPVPYIVRARDGAGHRRLEAFPADDSDPRSAWRHCSKEERRATQRVLGPCDYQARLGVNTGGANGVYWFEAVRRRGTIWRVRNLGNRGRSAISAREVDLESSYLYPALLGSRWEKTPPGRYWMLMVQDPRWRRGVEIDVLRREAPRSLDYLEQFVSLLIQRAAFRRFFQRRRTGAAIENIETVDKAAFYSMFNVGEYSLAPWKVVWHRMTSRLEPLVVGPFEDKPVLPQETHAFFPCQSQGEARYLGALLSSRIVSETLASLATPGSKSFATPSQAHHLRLARFDESNPLHRELSQLDLTSPTGSMETRLDRLAKEYWR